MGYKPLQLLLSEPLHLWYDILARSHASLHPFARLHSRHLIRVRSIIT